MRRPGLYTQALVASILSMAAAIGTGEAALADVIKLQYEAITTVEKVKGRAADKTGDQASPAVSVEVKEVGKAEAAKKETEKSEDTVVLGEDKFSYSKNDSESTLYDFKAKRVRLIENKTKTYIDVSLFPVVAFRDAEMQNRLMLCKVLKETGVGIPDEMFEVFSISADLGVLPPGETGAADIVVTENGDTITFAHGGKTVTEVTFGNTALEEPFATTYGRAILYKLKLHPLIWKQIMAKKRVIEKISFSAPKLPGEREHTTLRLLSSAREPGEVSTPGDYKRSFDPNSPLVKLQKEILLSGKPIAMPTRDQALAEAKKFIEGKQQVDAFLTLIEYSLATGDGATEAMRSIKEEIGDNQTITRIATMLAPRNEEDAKEFLEEFDEIEKTVQKKGYVLEIFKGNLASSIQAPADKMFLKALSANPLITGAYKDLGETYESQWRMDLAWDCFDLARALCPQHPLLENISAMEKTLQERHPEYF